MTSTERNAEAIINMAVMRQGVADRYFITAAPGRYKKGDILEDERTKERRKRPEKENVAE